MRSVQSAKFLTLIAPSCDSWPLICWPAWPDCTRRVHACSDDANVPSEAGIVRVDFCPIWWQPMQPLFFIEFSHSICVTSLEMPGVVPPNSLAAGIFSIEYQ